MELQTNDSAVGLNDTISLPTYDIAKKFAVETIDYPYPVGVHQARRFPKVEEVNLDDFCPEYKLASQYT